MSPHEPARSSGRSGPRALGSRRSGLARRAGLLCLGRRARAWRGAAALVVMAAGTSAVPAAAEIRWRVHHTANAQAAPAPIEPAEQTVTLRGGWTCRVGPATKAFLDAEARTTTCRNGDKAFAFSVQCNPVRPTSQTQIQLPAADGQVLDFIEVECALR